MKFLTYSRIVGVTLVLFITLLGASIITASTHEAGGTDTPQLSTNPTEAPLVNEANAGTSLLTNRQKVLTSASSLADVANEDIIHPAKPESVLVIQSAPNKSSDKSCEPVIGLSYKNSTPCWPQVVQPPKGAPNVVYIVLDDVGFGQLGCFGGPIQTPNIDKLAAGGLRYNNFHTTALCSPSRTCLLTGRNHQSAGIGVITEIPTGYPGYQMNLSHNTATLAEMLNSNGFNTFALGKWHLTTPQTSSGAGPFDNWPTSRGFDKYYGFLYGETDQWYPNLISGTDEVQPPATPEEGYHLTNDLVDHAIADIRDQQNVAPGKPFFLYFATGACHAPHQAPREYIDMYKGKFDKGWDAVRNETLARQKAMGIVPQNTALPPRNPGIQAWDALNDSQKKVYAREQEVFAGFLTHTDAQIGRLLDYLNSTGRLDNTLIFLVSDNGASQEGLYNGLSNAYLYFNGIAQSVPDLLTHIDELGGPKSYNHYAMGWAMAGNTPDRMYKQDTYEGGVHDPMIVYYPKLIKDKGAIRTQFTHAVDLVPTVLDVLGLQAPAVYNGYYQKPLEGVSFVSTFNDSNAKTGKYIQYFEMMGKRGLWYNGYKAVAYHLMGTDFNKDIWELYNMTADSNENPNQDLAAKEPDRLREMVGLWFDQAGKYNVLPLDDRLGSRQQALPVTGKFIFAPGQATIFEPTIPDTMNSSYNITAYVNRLTQGTQGVLLSIAGRNGGLSLFVQNNRLVFDYNYLGLRHYTVTSKSEVPTGSSILEMAFKKTGDHKGVATLYINGRDASSVGVVTEGVMYSWEEGLEIGKDTHTPVSDRYTSPFQFNGTIDKVVMEVPSGSEASLQNKSLGGLNPDLGKRMMDFVE
jgi:arylsulfatase A-like enzyme